MRGLSTIRGPGELHHLNKHCASLSSCFMTTPPPSSSSFCPRNPPCLLTALLPGKTLIQLQGNVRSAPFITCKCRPTTFPSSAENTHPEVGQGWASPSAGGGTKLRHRHPERQVRGREGPRLVIVVGLVPGVSPGFLSALRSKVCNIK